MIDTMHRSFELRAARQMPKPVMKLTIVFCASIPISNIAMSALSMSKAQIEAIQFLTVDGFGFNHSTLEYSQTVWVIRMGVRRCSSMPSQVSSRYHAIAELLCTSVACGEPYLVSTNKQ